MAVKLTKLIKVVTPKPQYGAPGIIIPIAVGGTILVGGYYIATRVLHLDFIKEAAKALSPIYDEQKQIADALGLPEPDPVFGQWGNMGQQLSDLFNWFSSAVSGSVLMVFSHDSRKQGETFAIAASGLKPSTPFYYGWKEIKFQLEVMSQPDGEWISPNIFVDYGTYVGVHTIYIDQRPWTGPSGAYGERKFTVLAGDT